MYGVSGMDMRYRVEVPNTLYSREVSGKNKVHHERLMSTISRSITGKPTLKFIRELFDKWDKVMYGSVRR